MRGRYRGLAFAVACALVAASHEPPFAARVKSVVDGDSLFVSIAPSHEVEVRLFGIDCPEGDQPYGKQAREALAGLVSSREIQVEPVDRDSYGRTVARIRVGERDVNAELVRAGAAWVYRRYTDDPKLIALESEARAEHRGLWGLPGAAPVPPWDWRHGKKTGGEPAFKCGAKHSCREMKSCAEARFYLKKCGVTSLDGNGDGVPCASLCR